MSRRRKKLNKNQKCFAFMRQPLPVSYAECLSTIDDRRAGKPCKHLTCRHNLIGELTRMSTRDAVRAMRAHQDGVIQDTCALDVAGDKVSDRDIATILGTGMGSMRRETRESKRRIGMHFWHFKPWKHPDCWSI